MLSQQGRFVKSLQINGRARICRGRDEHNGCFMAIIQSCVFREIYRREGGLGLERRVVHCSDKEVVTKY